MTRLKLGIFIHLGPNPFQKVSLSLSLSLSFCWSTHVSSSLFRCLKGHKSLGRRSAIQLREIHEYHCKPISIFAKQFDRWDNQHLSLLTFDYITLHTQHHPRWPSSDHIHSTNHTPSIVGHYVVFSSYAHIFQQPFLVPTAFKLSAESEIHFLLFLRKR